MDSNHFSTRIRDMALGVAEICRNSYAAELGAGTSFITEALVGAGANVIAVDQSKTMLAELNRKYASTARVDVRKGHAYRLPISDRNIDRVFANMYLHHVRYPGTAIKEMKRVLKPGGRLVVIDLDKHDLQFLEMKQHDCWRGFYRSDVRHWLASAGFSNIIVGTVPGERYRIPSNSGNEEAAANVFLATGTA